LNKRFRASYVIAGGFAALALLAVYGSRYANDYLLGREHFAPLQPGVVNIVGLDRRAGYSILVENRAAKLVMGGPGNFNAGSMDEKNLDSGEGEKKFVPIRDMLKSLRGDLAGLSEFVQRMNDIKDEDLPPQAPVWKMEDIDKALAGDAQLKTKLVSDLNVDFDGTPLPTLRRSTIQNGIVVDTPVPFHIVEGDRQKTVVARVKRPYKPSFMKTVEAKTSAKFATDDQTFATIYGGLAMEVASGASKENVRASFRRLKDDIPSLAALPQRILDSITVVLNENQITGAKYESVDTSKGKEFTLVLALSDEGRKRLWQFSRDRVGDQLLVTVNGVAIGAPRIEERIASGEVRITRLQDESLAQEAVEQTKNAKRTTTTK
jgi:hypothetical protein